MHRFHIATATLAAALVLGSCSGNGPDAADPMSTWTPSGTIESPSRTTATSSAAESPPLPSNATANNRRSAEEFINYYWALVDYATSSGDTKSLAELSGPRCGGCRGGVASIRNVYDAGGHIESAAYLVERVQLERLDLSTESRAFIATVRVRNDGQRIVMPDEPTKTSKVVIDIYVLTLLHVDGAWRVESIEIQQ